jgi:hypothetical protein
VVRTSGERAFRIDVMDGLTGDRVFDESFDRRIELATAAVSPSGRFTVHIQGNNIASEVTVLDALSGERWYRELPHDARLAAFAIDAVFDADETCVAISMERVGGEGGETWLLDLRSGEVQALPVADVFAIAWIRDQV